MSKYVFMRLKTAILLVAALILIFAAFIACNKDNNLASASSSASSTSIQSLEQTNAAENLHPFAIALQEFFEELPSDNWSDVFGSDFFTAYDEISNASAFLIDLDGKGNMGVVAYKGIGEVDFYRVFYLLDGELRILDFGGLWFYLFKIGEGPLITLTGGEGAGRQYATYSLEADGLAVSSILWETVGGEFYHSHTDFTKTAITWDESHKIFQTEFTELLRSYNIDDNRWLPFILRPQEFREIHIPDNFRPDDSETILAMQAEEY